MKNPTSSDILKARENIFNALQILKKILNENINSSKKIIDLRIKNQIIFSNE